MSHTRAPQDFIAKHARLRRRITDLATGVVPMHFYVGAFGLNSSWVRLTPGTGWHYSDSESYVRWRLRSDVVYLNTVGPGGVTPVSSEGWPGTKPALHLPGKPNVAWPSDRVIGHCLTTENGTSQMLVKPDGKIIFTKPTIGRILRPGSFSWPRG